ncbi:MAG: endonuclease III [Pyrinomonadaceae bacterium]|nr:endonuclease III [Pyrinomonadaceae bacterium]MCX7640525.1 endonuclease III [Pyrinomonadaceae bacterium]MDW8303894.1 endonuclease III [Acidobacteriota bacterium]
MRKVSEIIRRLKQAYPNVRTGLKHSNPFELLVATILSAQCTDERVNLVTSKLFQKYRKPEDYLAVSQEELAQDIRSINFFNNKARNIQKTAKKIIENFGGEVPKTMEELLTLDGVARKTANVVLGDAFGIASGIVVDTHVARVSQRLKLTENKAPEKIEKDLMQVIPREYWIEFSHWLINHGRKVCQARKPKCNECFLSDLCPSAKS